MQRLLTPPEVGKIIRKDTKDVRVLCDLGEIDHQVQTYPSGHRRIYITPEAVQEYMNKRTVRVGRIL